MKYILPIVLLLTFFSASAQEQFTIYFDSDSDEPTEISKAKFAEWLKHNQDADVNMIAAYTDTVGSEEYNNLLAVRRTKYLIVQLQLNGMLHKWKVITPGEIEYKEGTNAENRKAIITYTKPEPVVTAEEPKVANIMQSVLTKEIQAARKGDKIRLKNLHFYGSSGKVLSQSEPVLEDLLKVMKENPGLRLDIQGHVCCDIKDPVGVSYKRAVSVYNYLITGGIEKSRLTYHSFGGRKPLHPIPEKSPQEREENRRVELEIL